jgi:polysaccharide export outer membrane protein
MKHVIVFSLLFLICSGLSIAQDYIVGEGDVLQISVYDNPDLNITARVEGDGTIIFPLVGVVGVEGLTVTQISNKLGNLLADGYIIDPQVSVFIREFKSRKVIIMGQVNSPGLYELRGTKTLLEILSSAGGLTQNAGDKAIIKRKGNSPRNGEEVIAVDLKKLMESGDTSQYTIIMDGDSIYITKAGVFYVTGEVRKPSAYRYEDGTTIIKAITMAGGFTDKASTSRIKIIRKINGEEKVMENVESDESVLPEDVIVVPESFF